MKNDDDECVKVLPEKNVECRMNVQNSDNMSVAVLSVHNGIFGQDEVCRNQIVNSEAKMTRCSKSNGGPQSIGGGGKAQSVISLDGGKFKIRKREIPPKTDTKLCEKTVMFEEKINILKGEQKQEILTPIKRKLCEENNTSSLVCIFETKTETFKPDEKISESPAKRRKCVELGSVTTPDSTWD